MNSQLTWRHAVTALALLTLLVLSALHANIFGAALNFDIDQALRIVAVLNFVMANILPLPERRLARALIVILSPVIPALAFSWAELFSTFSAKNSEAAWGLLWLGATLAGSYSGATAGFLVRLALSKLSRRKQ